MLIIFNLTLYSKHGKKQKKKKKKKKVTHISKHV